MGPVWGDYVPSYWRGYDGWSVCRVVSTLWRNRKQTVGSEPGPTHDLPRGSDLLPSSRLEPHKGAIDF